MERRLHLFVKFSICITIAMATMHLSAQEDCVKNLDNWNKKDLPPGKIVDYEKCVKDLEDSTKNIEAEIKKLENEIKSRKNQVVTLKKSYDKLIKHWDDEDNGVKSENYKKKKIQLDKIKL